MKFLELEVEEKKRNELIKQALDRMNNYYGKVSGYVEPVEEDEITSNVQQPTKPKTSPTNKADRKKPLPLRKILAVAAVATILILSFLFIPKLIPIIPTSQTLNGYTELRLTRDYSPSPTRTTVKVGDLDYMFLYDWGGFLSVINSLGEGKGYGKPVNGSVYNDYGMELQITQVSEDQLTLLIRGNPNYFSQTGYTRLTIAQGQTQTITFSGNEYTIAHLQETGTVYNQGVPAYQATVSYLVVATPLLQNRKYYATNGSLIDCDLGLTIKVYKTLPEYITLYTKPSY